MDFFKKFKLYFSGKKNPLLPEKSQLYTQPIIEPTAFQTTDTSQFKTLATFDLTMESPKYEGAIPEASIHFYPIK